MRFYLDACCLSRLTDDQSRARIREEAEAVEQVLAGVRRGAVELVSSEALEDEVRDNPSMERRMEAQTTLALAVARIEIEMQSPFVLGVWSDWAIVPSMRSTSRQPNPLRQTSC